MRDCCKPTICFLYTRYYDFGKSKVITGGIQTYITNLLSIFTEAGYPCIVVQCGAQKQEVSMPNVHIYEMANPQRDKKSLFRFALNMIDTEKDIVIFADDDIAVKNCLKRTIGIQHGIAWDKPYHTNFSKTMSELWVFKKAFLAYQKVKTARTVRIEVCVDNNFINWYRSMVAYPTTKLISIPNFTKVEEFEKKEDGNIRIIFARRFVWYRGTRIFTQAITRILNEYPEVRVTMAGRGPDEEMLKNTLSQYGERVAFINYESQESQLIHAQHDIAVVPTIGSEGTSLSLLEAMVAKCAVICSNVGGMTNVVINNYNGLMISSEAEAIYTAIKQLIEDSELRHTLAKRAFETVQCGFSFELWKDRWLKVIEDIEKE